MKQRSVVWLKANLEEGWKREQAEILSYDIRSDTYCVQLLNPSNPKDDGIREVTDDQFDYNC